MSALTRLEGFLKDAVEGPVRLLSAGRIHPLEMAEALSRELEQNVLVRDGTRSAPDVFEVHLNPGDLQNVARARTQLESELANYLAEFAVEKDCAYDRRPEVRLVGSEVIRAGEVAAYSRFDEVLRDSQLINVASQTKAFSVAEVRRLAQGAARITVVGGGSAKGKTFELKSSPFVIGRSPDTDAQIEDLRLSRRHAELTFDADRFTIRDLGSTNGTFVNDVPVSGRRPVKPGDRISLGGVELRLSAR